jgi:hypothetical protein
LTVLFLGLLVLAWIAVFLPAAMRARRGAPLSTAERFKRRMDLIAPRARAGRWVVVPEPYDRLARASFRRGQRRRKRILTFLITAAVASFVAATAAGGAYWTVNLACDLSLALYAVLLREAKRRRVERFSKVRDISRRRAHEEVTFFEPKVATGDHR